jgi:hypothetical protein
VCLRVCVCVCVCVCVGMCVVSVCGRLGVHSLSLSFAALKVHRSPEGRDMYMY